MKYMPKTIGPKFPIVLTSYEVALNDARKYLRHYNWKYVVVDEVNPLLVNHQMFLFTKYKKCGPCIFFFTLNIA